MIQGRLSKNNNCSGSFLNISSSYDEYIDPPRFKFSEAKQPWVKLWEKWKSIYCPIKIVLACRGGGKTIMAMQYFMLKMEEMKNFRCIFYAAAINTGMDTIRTFMNELVYYYNQIGIKVKIDWFSHRWEFHFADDNIGEFRIESYNKPQDRLRGPHPHLGIVDEGSGMPYSFFDQVLIPLVVNDASMKVEVDADPEESEIDYQNLQYTGEILMIGTPQKLTDSTGGGNLKFIQLFKQGLDREKYPTFYSTKLKATDSGLLPRNFVESKRKSMSEEAFEQEYECNTELTLGTAFVYSAILYELEKKGQISNDIEYDAKRPVYTTWDLGFTCNTSVWFFQVIGAKLNIIDFYEGSKMHMSEHAVAVLDKGYPIFMSIVPHDSTNKRVEALNTNFQILSEYGLRPVRIERNTGGLWKTGVKPTRELLVNCWFHADKTKVGRDHLRQYRQHIDKSTAAETGVPILSPDNDASDAFRYIYEGKHLWEPKNYHNNDGIVYNNPEGSYIFY
jgi:hypothetical protein